MKFTDSPILYTKLKSFYPKLKHSEKELSKAYYKVLTFFADDFCKNLKAIRVKKNLSQKYLVDKLKVSISAYSAWETGLHLPKIEYIKMLSDLLEVDPAVFIESDDSVLGSSSKKVPIIDSSFFAGKSYLDFKKLVEDFTSNEYLANRFTYFAKENEEDFLFDLVTDDMKSNAAGILPHSLVGCSYKQLEGLNFDEILTKFNGKIMVVSLFHGPCILRQLNYDGEYIILRAWNEKITDKIIPYRIKKEQIKVKVGELTKKDLEIFGVAIDAIVMF